MSRFSKYLILLALLPTVGLAASASENWENICSKCNGMAGDGNTPQGKKLHVKNYTDPKMQAEFSDASLMKNLLLGIESGGKERMPRFKDKLTIDEAKELIAFIRTLKK